MAGEFKQKITIQFQGAGKAEKGAKKVESSMGKLGKSVLKAGAAFFGAKAIISGMTKAFSMASQAEALEKGFKKLGSEIGFTGNSLNRLSSAVDGTVNKVDLMKAANQAMTLGVVGSEEEMAKLFDTAQRLGQSLGVDTVSAVDSLVTGMGRQSIMMLDNLGIIVDTKKANEDYAESIGKTVDQLTDQERKVAFNNAALAAAEEKVEILGVEQLGAADATAQFQVAIDDLLTTLGDSFLPVLGKVISGVTSFISGVADFFGLTPDVNDAIAEMDDALFQEESTLKRLMMQLKDENTTKERKGKLIRILNSEYGQYAEHLLTESSSLQDIATYEEEVMANLEDSAELKKLKTEMSIVEQKQEEKLKELNTERNKQVKEWRDELSKALPQAEDLYDYLLSIGVENSKAMEAALDATEKGEDGQRKYKDVLSLTDDELIKMLEHFEMFKRADDPLQLLKGAVDTQPMKDLIILYNELQLEIEAITKREEDFIQGQIDEGDAINEKNEIITEEGRKRKEFHDEMMAYEEQYNSEAAKNFRAREEAYDKEQVKLGKLLDAKLAAGTAEFDAMMEEEEWREEQEEMDDEYQENRIRKMEEKRHAQGLLTEAEKKYYEERFANQDLEAKRDLEMLKAKKVATKSGFSAITELLGFQKKHAKAQATIQAVAAMVDAFQAAQIAFRQAALNPITVVNPAYPAIVYATTLGQGLAQAAAVKSAAAAEGMDEIVTEPTLILAGEEGPEYVDIEPTTNEGAGRGGVNVTFSGNVLSRDFIEDEALPLIKEALRKGGSIGVS